MRLRELDERAVPVAAVRLRAALERLTQLRVRLSAWGRRWEPAALDSRYGGRGPFRVLSARPLVGAGLAAAVLVAGVGVAVVREGEATSPTSRNDSELLPQGDAPQGGLLGPQVGDVVRDYVRSAADGLADAARTAPSAARVALVSLADYRTPEQTAALLSGFTVNRVYLRARDAGREATALPIDVHGPLLAALRTAYADTARSRAAAQKAYQGYVDTLRPDSTQNRQFRDLYSSFARASGIESRAYASDCACVYAALVTASPTLLLALGARPGVRAVELAGPGLTVLQVQAQPLLPEVSSVVPRPSFTKLS